MALTAFAVDASTTPGRLRSSGARSGTVDVTIERWSTDEERKSLQGARKEGGLTCCSGGCRKIHDPPDRSTRLGRVGDAASAFAWQSPLPDWRPPDRGGHRRGRSGFFEASQQHADDGLPVPRAGHPARREGEAPGRCCRSRASRPARRACSTSRPTRRVRCVSTQVRVVAQAWRTMGSSEASPGSPPSSTTGWSTKACAPGWAACTRRGLLLFSFDFDEIERAPAPGPVGRRDRADDRRGQVAGSGAAPISSWICLEHHAPHGRRGPGRGAAAPSCTSPTRPVKRSHARGIRTVSLLGTRFTMEQDFYKRTAGGRARAVGAHARRRGPHRRARRHLRRAVPGRRARDASREA